MSRVSRLATSVVFVWFAVQLAVHGVALAEDSDACGNALTQEDFKHLRTRDIAGAYVLPAVMPPGPVVVPVTFHVVRRSDGGGGLSEARLAQTLTDLNTGFEGSGITFCRPGPLRYVDSDEYYNIESGAERRELLAINPVPNTINLYFVGVFGFCGFSSFTGSSAQGIVVANYCAGVSNNPTTVPHEVGHYFDLLHTHETAFGNECVDGSNCATAGDLVCDTPADPGLITCGPEGRSSCVDSTCAYTGSAADPDPPCAGDTYAPDPANVMSYSRKICRRYFSEGQGSRALATLVNLRPEHLPCGQREITSSAGFANQEFGFSVSMSGNVAIVGATEQTGANTGSAYVFRFNGKDWVEQQLPASGLSGGALYGASVSNDGDWTIVGAPGDQCADGSRRCGSVYFYDYDGSDWLERRVALSDPEAGDLFGWSVAIDGDTAVVGTPARECPDGSRQCGVAYIYEYDGIDWVGRIITAPGASAEAHFGWSVAISGNSVFVGAPGQRCTDGSPNCGAVHVFDLSSGGSIGTQIESPRVAGGRFFGTSVSVKQDVAGFRNALDVCPDGSSECSSTYIYRYNAATDQWLEEVAFTVPDDVKGDLIGYPVSVGEDVVASGVARDDCADGSRFCGAMYVYRYDGIGWTEQKIIAPKGVSNDGFGVSVAVSGDVAIAGAMWRDCAAGTANCGAAYVTYLPGCQCSASAIPRGGDADGDLDVDLEDYAAFDACVTGSAGRGGPTCDFADADADGDVDLEDFGAFQARFTGRHDCCDTGTRGCADPTVEDCVCAADSYCCEAAWDTQCVNQVATLGCGECAHACCATGGPGCEDPGIEACICSADAFCCESEWDSVCVDEVWNDGCGDCPHDCCDTGGPGCENAVGDEGSRIEDCVCAADPYCCETEWDEQCVSAVGTLGCGDCTPSPTTDVCIDLTAEVAYVDDRDALLGETIFVGQIITGRYIYDSTTSDSNASPTVGDYWHNGPPYGITIDAGSLKFQTDPLDVEFLVEIINDHGTATHDNYLLRSSRNLPASPTVAVEHISWQLGDPTSVALSDDTLPTGPPVLDDWESVFGVSINGCTVDDFHKDGHCTGSTSYFVRAHVISARLCPDVGGR